jgi:sialidase-1
MMEKQDLFTARTGKYWNYRIPSLLATPDDLVLLGCEARPGQGGDYDENDVLIRRSTDGGKTFAEPIILADHSDYGPGPLSNLVMLNDPASARIHALFCHDYRRVHHTTSDDGGKTFAPPVEITAAIEPLREQFNWCVCATGPGQGLTMRNGRMLAPVWLSDGGENSHGEHRGHCPSLVTTLVSDDGGKTWQGGQLLCGLDATLDGQAIRNPSEASLIETVDGRVMMNMRNVSEPHRRLIATSDDGTSGWTMERFDETLTEPICMAGLVRQAWPEGDEPGCLVFSNPGTLEKEFGCKNFDRKQLTVYLSFDDGQTWPVQRILEPGPSAYSDLTTLSDGTILCAYECGMGVSMYDSQTLRLARFDRDWVEDKG